MKILVTGSNGFVGCHLTSHLASLGHTVGGGVRSQGSAPERTTEVVMGDLSGATDWTGLLQGFDVVIHLAARVHVMNDTSADPLSEFRRVNSLATAALARAAATQGVTRLVFLSSIKVNGESTSGRGFTALDRPAPNDPYGISKHEAEVALRGVERDSDLEIVIVRTPLVYGPGVKGNFAKMLSLVHVGVPLPLGALRNRRTMVSVWNLVDLLEKCSVDPRAAGALVLAGDAFSPSTPQLLREMTSAMGKKPRVFPLPLAFMRLGGRLTGKTAVVSRLTESLEVVAGSSSTDWAWKPPHAFADSILRTVTWYLENRKSEVGGRKY
ncbi:NAD-dependent epimerase/dehydratase family protein [Cryobacterium sp. TMT2-23]|uniref:NAD-dependent epimerase/dehydratase family protein n=1 Tax=Cryobacterium sp. TMT2-23 TaxID=1259252 RepID=UPI00106D8244|nr:NAD-dependent epimerase/dehydratase family protein [Cryobacterium sp. TMT2-23]TFD17776.1 NAD-dependent epimerase/dehydratase family protein [Cryobacterium sp. TMT2-23]